LRYGYFITVNQIVMAMGWDYKRKFRSPQEKRI